MIIPAPTDPRIAPLVALRRSIPLPELLPRDERKLLRLVEIREAIRK